MSENEVEKTRVRALDWVCSLGRLADKKDFPELLDLLNKRNEASYKKFAEKCVGLGLTKEMTQELVKQFKDQAREFPGWPCW